MITKIIPMGKIGVLRIASPCKKEIDPNQEVVKWCKLPSMKDHYVMYFFPPALKEK